MVNVNVKYYDIIRRPVISEKSSYLGEKNKLVFLVDVLAGKSEIKSAIESLFGVKVSDINTINMYGKVKVFRGRKGRRAAYKKAIVTLVDGQSLDIVGV
jgi:large subunit ribosomal protein L23